MALFLLVSFFLLLAHPVVADQAIQLQRQGGIYVVPVRINNAITLNFVLDSGAADVLILADVVLVLFRTGTVASRDFVGARTYSLADGSELASDRFILRELKVGDYLVRNVTASLGPVRSEPLLGQSFLAKFASVTLDNHRHVLVLSDKATSIESKQTAAIVPEQTTAAMNSPHLPQAAASPAELVHTGYSAFARKDYAEAMRWFQMAAAQGNAEATNNIGVLTRVVGAFRGTTRRRCAGTAWRLPREMPLPRTISAKWSPAVRA
jgi:hypothetical protein